MGRMHSGGKGISASAKPYKRSPPSWLKISSQDMKRKRQCDDVSEQLRELEKIVKEMKEDWNTRMLYEKAKDDFIRAVLIKEHPDLIRTLPPFPIDLLWQSAERQPTQRE